MLPAIGSTMMQAMSSPYSSMTRVMASESLKGTVIVSFATPSVTPGLEGTPKVASPEPASTSRLSLCPW